MARSFRRRASRTSRNGGPWARPIRAPAPPRRSPRGSTRRGWGGGGGGVGVAGAGYAGDQAPPFAVVPNTNASRYRDWVIAALNQDMPYARFVKLQIAADLIEKDDASRIKNLPALGFFG